ncbi:ABC transporter permease/M1 family aminopeptidase [Thalassotalea hakodatensis]|uniref:ABC transporter permease/M1 family aminopeptidase n=1 Tax=Thalassotalea hakodatensis TaxID=3030492 RepID=UPI0025732824|nr:M1 family aminopeptidase [Thalassotalea hakodatensis]
MLKGLTLFELKYHLKQGSFWAVTFCFVWMAVLINSQRGSALLYANSASAITQTLLFISPYIIFALCVLASATLIRDSQFKMESIIFTTPMDKFQYLASRYLGIVTSSIILFAIVLVAMMLGVLFLDESLVGPINISHYFLAFFIFILPTILLCSSVVFSTAMLSKNTIAVYVAGITIFVLYLLVSILGNSPLIAGSNTLLSDSNGFTALMEPYGLIAFMEQSAFWNSTQRNILTPELSGNLLLNRLLWLAVSAGLFSYTYHKFSFRTVNKISKKPQRTFDNQASQLSPIQSQSYQTVKPQQDFEKFNVSIWFSKLKLEYLTATKGKTFIVLLLVTMVFTLGNLAGNIFNGPINNGQPYYPLTSIILELLEQPLADIGMLIAIFYSVELYWNERDLKVDSLVDTTPTRNVTFYLAKLITVIMVCFTLITTAIVIAIGFQLSQGIVDIQPWLYLILYYYAGVPMLLAAFLALSLQRLAKNKALGLLLALAVFFLSVFVKNLGLEHPLTILAYRPQFIFSNMADTIYHDGAVHWYNLYWLSFGLIISLLTVKYWQRGNSNIAQKLSRSSTYLLASVVVIFLTSGSYIFYQTNIFNEYSSKEQTLRLMQDYEVQYAALAHLPQPTVIDINVNVDIFPDTRRYQAKGRYIIENQTQEDINEVMVSIFKQSHITQNITFNEAALERYDEKYQTYFFTLNTPMKAGEKRTLTFDFSVTHNAFSALDGEHYVTKGGAYIELEDIMPQFGYDLRYVIDDEEERSKRGLPLVKLAMPTKDMQISRDDWVNFETIVSTKKSHQALTVGRLKNTWLDEGRRFFHYQTDGKVQRQLAYISAEFEQIRETYKGVEISLFHSPEHNKDSQYVLNALKHTMDYFSENFGDYQSNQFTVVELPYFSSAQSFGSAQPGMYLGVENRFFNLDNRNVENSEFNPLLRGVSHEFSHQYWGGYIEPNYVGGYALLTETLSKYSELVLSRKVYGEYSTNLEVHLSLDRYLRARSYSNNIEKPLFSTGMEPHIYYAKGKQTMHALLDLLGEEKINQALRDLLSKHGYPNKPTSLDLLNEFYLVSNDGQKGIIDDLFKRVVFHDFSLHSAKTTLLNSGFYETEIDISTVKLVLDVKTNTEEKAPINDSLDVALYSGFPKVNNENMLSIQKVKFNKERNIVLIKSKEKPSHVTIDPNRFRIDRNIADNTIAVKLH